MNILIDICLGFVKFLLFISKSIHKLCDRILESIWWRYEYKKQTITFEQQNAGRCLRCDAGIYVRSNKSYMRCDKDHPCPCKENQILILK